MTLTDLASLGSFVSSLAVLVSLGLLGLQVQQASKNQRALMQQGRSGRTVDILLRMSEPQMAAVLGKAYRCDETLDEAQIISFYGFAAATFWNSEDSFLQFKAGTLDVVSWENDVATLKGLLRNPAYRAAWSMARYGSTGGYAEFVDSLLQDVKPQRREDITERWRALVASEAAQG
jgi:hypothetical protein